MRLRYLPNVCRSLGEQLYSQQEIDDVDRTYTRHPRNLFGGFSGRFGGYGYGYGYGHGGMGVVGVIILVVLLLMGRL